MKLTDDTKKRIDTIVDAGSYYPECERKDRKQREADMLVWLEKYGEVNEYYNYYGMDRLEVESCDDWLDMGIFLKQRHEINAKWFPLGSSFPYDYTLLMRDKLAFEMFARLALNDDSKFCKTIGVIINDALFEVSDKGRRIQNPTEFFSNLEGEKLILKQSFGHQGEKVKLIQIGEKGRITEGDETSYSPEEFIHMIHNRKVTWLIQRAAIQHKDMMRLNKSSVNTVRIITYNTGERIICGKAVVKMGKSGEFVDNLTFGGLSAGLTCDGIIADSAFDLHGEKRIKCEFAGFKIPYFKEVEALACYLHSLLPGLFSIGWDIAVGTTGPFVVEGNDGWAPFLVQAPIGHAQRKVWDELLRERMQYYNLD